MSQLAIKWIKRISFILILIIVSFSLVTFASSSPKFGLPINCNLGKNCYIMHYVDHDPTSKEIDFNCGRQTYDTHNGTDFGIPNLQVMKQGIPVISIADGIVLRLRDGVADHLVASESDKKATEGQECGNGLVIKHEDGWESQYCHLKQNSIVVKNGMKVKKGTILGMVGSSGLASFPHVHLSLRQDGKIVDPFVGITEETGCQMPKKPLWEKSLNYIPTGLIEGGFAPEIPSQKKLWEGKFYHSQINIKSPQLIFWIHAFGVLENDEESFQLINPNNQVIINQKQPINKSSRSWMSYVGKNNKSTLEKGLWIGKYQLKRGNKIMINLEQKININ
ncbi:M23 family metallopeptidase [Geminocystis sp. GBBB08]|uniref:M23 family metallopeptidase n=1 Tax=Geminocystis sp. GBBB08 TaxID=2604140 RepID=UPI0027E32FD3|nr:M23 family metallopeptidase [Geminocystis sp. GBBB08]MBL1210071.1 M23 family metallopeptidase [Geminocystis sp. GBBB08]